MPHHTDKEQSPKGKNSLTIRLTESAVFLRSDGSIRDNARAEGRSSVLRGLLILNLVKPTKISGIEIELVGKTETAWPEGAGARKTETTEEHRFFRASTTFFEASKAHPSRRTASLGPGVAIHDHDSHHDDWEESSSDAHLTHHSYDGTDSESIYNTTEDFPLSRRHLRNVSVDTSNWHPHHVSYREEHFPNTVPPYSPLPPPLSFTPSSSNHTPSNLSTPLSRSQNPSPAQSLEEFRAALLIRERNALSSPSHAAIVPGYSPSRREISFSRQPSMGDVPEDDMEEQLGYSRSVYRGLHVAQQTSTLPSDHDHDRGRRKHHRFSFANVSSALMDVVRGSQSHARSREHSREDSGRGRSKDKKPYLEITSPLVSPNGLSPHGNPKNLKEHHFFDKFGGVLKHDPEEHKEGRRDWKEFKKGLYTYPISFQIPVDSPPSMMCDYGAVTWRLRAHVHRPGTFTPKYTAERPVIVVSCPTEDDTEENENIIVERYWDHQLQYLIAISGRSFYIGGTLPVTFTMLPLTKAKVYRISVYLEERIDYYTNMKRLVKSDPVGCFELLSIRNDGKNPPPVLPLQSDDPEAFRKSPWYTALSSQLESDDDVSDLASRFMGPGPWNFHLDLKLPKSCMVLKPTNKNKRANMIVTHLLKIVMRMERGDDRFVDKNGKKKLFDIVVQTPVHILSCRCNPEWTSLPQYSESLHQVEHVVRSCPCRTPQDLHPLHRSDTQHPPNTSRTILKRTPSFDSTDSDVSAADDLPVDPTFMASLRQPRIDNLVIANRLFERLVSGQQSELGETPPAYEATSAQPVSTLGLTAVNAS